MTMVLSSRILLFDAIGEYLAYNCSSDSTNFNTSKGSVFKCSPIRGSVANRTMCVDCLISEW